MEKTTPLFQQHASVGARMVPFAGYRMPLEYAGILEEHRAVRSAAGLFDLSHMGEFKVTGLDAVSAVDSLVTNDVRGLEEFQVRYTPMCRPDGGIVDDLLVYRYPDHLMLVVNAANIEKDFGWIREHVTGDVCVENWSEDLALIAIQGPMAERIVETVTDLDLPSIAYYHFTVGQVSGASCTVSRTGYTGEDGFELYLDPADAPRVWEALLEAGAKEGIRPIGLGARDTLRLEAGYMLYGNDIDDTTSPIEAGLGWTVKFLDDDFVGREVLERQKREGVSRRLVALEMTDRRIPRPHYPIWVGEEVAGEVTSGTFSPTFNTGIALGYLRTGDAKTGTEVEIEARAQRHPARVVRKPMYKR